MRKPSPAVVSYLLMNIQCVKHRAAQKPNINILLQNPPLDIMKDRVVTSTSASTRDATHSSSQKSCLSANLSSARDQVYNLIKKQANFQPHTHSENRGGAHLDFTARHTRNIRVL